MGLSDTFRFTVSGQPFSCVIRLPFGGGGVRVSQMEFTSIDDVAFYFNETLLCERVDDNPILPPEWTPRITPPIKGHFYLQPNAMAITLVR